MDDMERFEYEINRRLLSETWDFGVSKHVLEKATARRKLRLSMAGGAAAAVIIVAAAAGLYTRPAADAKSEANTLVMQQINGTYNATVGSSSSSYSDPIDAEISDALWTR